MNLTGKQELFCSATYKKALTCAAKAHARQLTPNGAPYMVHVNTVAMEVIQSLHFEPLAFDEATLAVCCALLHDTIEDTELQSADLEEFGPEIAAGVMALTKDKALDKRTAMQDSLARLKVQPLPVQRVKLADRITNLDPSPAHWDIDKCRNYQGEAQLILDELREASVYLALRLDDKITSYHKYFVIDPKI